MFGMKDSFTHNESANGIYVYSITVLKVLKTYILKEEIFIRIYKP